jgi:type I restriction enzyme S subunit
MASWVIWTLLISITWTTDGAKAGTVFCRNGKFNCTNVCGTIKLKSDNHFFVAKVLGRIAPRHVSRHLGNPKLMNDVMKRVKIPLPPTKAEQEAIAAILTDMDAEIGALETKLAKAHELRQGMMQQLLTGRTRLI